MLTAPACEATQRMQRVFCPPVAVNAAGNSSPADSGGGRYLRFLRGWGPQKNPLDPLDPTVPAPRWTPGKGDTSGFYAGWGPQKTHWTHWPRCALPRPLPVHDLAPEVPRLPRYGHPGPKGVRPPCPPCRGPLGATLRPRGSPRPKPMKRLG